MRPSQGVRWFVLLAGVGCAHSPPEAPTLAGRAGWLSFDRTSIKYGDGPRAASLTRVDERTWRGTLPCGLPPSPGDVVVGEIELTEEGLSVRQRHYPVTVTSEAIVVHEAFTDLVFRRSDGGPVPAELIVPLTMVVDFGAFCPKSRPTAPWGAWGVWLEVDGIGRVEALAVPADQGAGYLRAGNPGAAPAALVAASSDRAALLQVRPGSDGPPPADLTAGPPPR